MSPRTAQRNSIYLELPGETIHLAAAGKVALTHGQLEQTLRMLYKTLTGLKVKEALDATEGMKNWELRKICGKLFNHHTSDVVQRERFRAILGKCKRLSEERNSMIHNCWAIDDDGSVVVKSPSHQYVKAPTPEELEELAEEIQSLAIQINTERRTGFINDIVQAAFASAP